MEQNLIEGTEPQVPAQVQAAVPQRVSVDQSVREYHAERVGLDADHQRSEDQKFRAAISAANDIARQGFVARAAYGVDALVRENRAHAQQARVRHQSEFADAAMSHSYAGRIPRLR